MLDILGGPVGPVILAGMRSVALAFASVLCASELLRAKSPTFWLLSAANVGGLALLLAELAYASPVSNASIPLDLAPLRAGLELLFVLVLCLGFQSSLWLGGHRLARTAGLSCSAVAALVLVGQLLWLQRGAERHAFAQWWFAQLVWLLELAILLATAVLVGRSPLAARHSIATSLVALSAGVAVGGRLLTVGPTGAGPLGDLFVGSGFLLLACAIFFNVVATSDEHAAARATLQQRIADEQRAVLAGTMAAGIAHEIASPLTALAHHAKRAMSTDDAEKRQRSLGLILDEIWRVAGIAHSLTQFARPGADEIRLVRPEKVLADLLVFVEPELRQRKVRARVQSEGEPPPVQVNPERLRQVFLNLLRNAWEATEPGGEIVALVKSAGDTVRIEVRDTGKGIPADRLPHLFEPFFSDKGDEGSGLGLFVCRELVLSYGGDIRAESQLGSGSRFMVELPVGVPATPRPGQ